MVDILPVNTELPDIQEGGSVNQTFIAQLEATDTLESINIIDFQPTPGITVSGANYKGVYESVFSFGGDALKYREGDEFKVAQSWESLPPSGAADLYLWKAPSKLERTFTYTVKVIYWRQGEDTTGPSGEPVTPPPVQMEMTKTYSQLVYGNWSKWAEQLRSYVYARP